LKYNAGVLLDCTYWANNPSA